MPRSTPTAEFIESILSAMDSRQYPDKKVGYKKNTFFELSRGSAGPHVVAYDMERQKDGSTKLKETGKIYFDALNDKVYAAVIFKSAYRPEYVRIKKTGSVSKIAEGLSELYHIQGGEPFDFAQDLADVGRRYPAITSAYDSSGRAFLPDSFRAFRQR